MVFSLHMIKQIGKIDKIKDPVISGDESKAPVSNIILGKQGKGRRQCGKRI